MQRPIDEYRQPWESSEHWELRREFIVANQGRFSENRVLCLAQAFANVELLGCTYPAAVMAQVNELAKNVSSLSVVQEKRRENSRVLFVKGEDDAAKRRKTSSLGTYTRAPRYDDQSRMRAASFFQR
ncbi:hypothetical protein HPB51_024298 [Rhipicephalus microplus]|uniref:XRN2-binding (XTBD) domain-containing protein n=1 Tax=Rhipicephalus microplus TaxID=6941 RepID=A0A9J6EV01_RHIMP|nr:partner of xrn-2 protein 1-like [Rhipicephalus microplus]KAH8038158.1 hypothetical protein HPB51_024298 [Rhipicephalus microplus]